MILGDLCDFESGIIISRVSEEQPEETSERKPMYHLYENDQFDNNPLLMDNETSSNQIFTEKDVPTLKENDVVINLYRAKAVKVNNFYSNYIINANFVKIDINDTLLDKAYFLYWFNESLDSKKQLIQDVQGSFMRKTTISQLKEMQIILPDLDVQTLIGGIYEQQIKLNNLYEKKMKLSNVFSKGIIQNIERGSVRK